jgi:hypothetical protein
VFGILGVFGRDGKGWEGGGDGGLGGRDEGIVDEEKEIWCGRDVRRVARGGG